MKHHVKYLGKCPFCGADNVGIIKFDLPFSEASIMEKERKRNGWHVLVKDPMEYRRSGLNPNCFCYDCNHEWISDEAPKKLTFETDEEYYEYLYRRNLTDEQNRIKTFTKPNRLLQRIRNFL